MSHLSQGSLSGPAKLKAVTGLVSKLSHDLKTGNLSPDQRDAALEELKVYGRDPSYADPIFTKEGIETLTRHAFDSSSKTTSQNALRVICNAMLLKPATRQTFVELGCEVKACINLKNDNRDDEFLLSRIIFLTTYNTSVDLPKLIEQHELAQTITENLSRHAARVSSKAAGKAKSNPMEDMALTETLKLLFNVTRFCPDHLDSFAVVIPHIVTLLNTHDTHSTGPPLEPPFGPMINTLVNLKLDTEAAKASLFPSSEAGGITDRLMHFLELSMRSYADSELEQAVTPLVCVLSRLYEYAPEEIRQLFRSRLLPTEEDRQKVLGTGDTLASRLLRNSTNPVAPEFRKAISHLFFDMSDKDAAKFIQNVGYGFASGFLFQNNIPIPESSAPDVLGNDKRDTNPITGQFRDAEKFADMPEMTEEEKEREAERLFVLFERLKKNGLISVQNPVEQAMQSGRIEELKDDDEEDLD
ncbi:guanine nucleotide exchange factor [Apodospora peruviana]|uniref:Guanine nucleotide exchange factor n=1 Tax=Apodospora peruviana TaxID=516989 RepID=A0AAE0MEL3_9PEZI|nr:guanine nucleotide exchange factor [Apodospora peruviana]